MRKAAEPADDLAVLSRPRQRRVDARLGGERGEQRDGALLHVEPLAVLERHVQERPLVRVERTVEAAVDRVVGRRERAGVAGELLGRAAECVARELVEQHDARERAVQPSCTIRRTRRRCRRRARRRNARESRDRTRRPCGTTRRATTCGCAPNQNARISPASGSSGRRRERRIHRGVHAVALSYGLSSRSRRCRARRLRLAFAVQTSRRDIFLLACCQALLLTNASGLISMNGLVGFSLAHNKSLATFGATTYVLGSALAAMPMALWMAQGGTPCGVHGRALRSTSSAASLGALALQSRSFPLFCVATGIIGVYNAVGLQYRFAAAEVAAPATSRAGDLAGARRRRRRRPDRSRRRRDATRDLFATPFQGSLVMLALVRADRACRAVARARSAAVARRAHRQRPAAVASIVRQPAFIVAVLAGGA